ncbi:MAG: T9SS type A sorting domain-containing protein [Ignavibacteriae bacterium]|nr:T9SS type A sorting domain-containing protein [Ignavibacteriota bacterium]
MKNFLNRKTKFIISLAVIALITSISIELIAYGSGYTLRTLKTTTQGCGSCHSQNSACVGTITGPDTVIAGQNAIFTITVTQSGKTKAGIDIAVRLGSLLAAPGANLKIQNNEITQSSTLSMSGGTVSRQFTYVAPTTAGIDTIFATVTTGTSAWYWAPSRRVVVKTASGIENNTTPVSFRLNQNYPNPFNPVTKINYSIAKSGNVKITVYDILGNSVYTLVNHKHETGNYSLDFDGSNLASGTYIYKIEAGEFTDVKKMTLIK